MSPVTNGVSSETLNDLSKWITNAKVHKAIQKCVGDFDRIIRLSIDNVSKIEDNYSSQMLRISTEVSVSSGNTKQLSFILKTLHNDEAMANILEQLKLFPKEETMYHKIIPKFETLYKDLGKSVQFAPSAFKFDQDLGYDYVLLEDLTPRGYKNANNSNGLDMVHMQHVLEKLAQFHAASACYVEHYGMYDTDFTNGIYTNANQELLKEFNSCSVFLAQLKKWQNCEKYYEKLMDSENLLVERLLEDQKFNPREFNVLNHGDCWANNIMFQYDAFGNIKNSVFIDFQMGKYGSPANDLYYLILSSAAMEIKLQEFDYMIWFYYDKLIENLQLLHYHRPLPKLKNLRMALLNNGLAAYLVVTKVLPLVLWDKSVGFSVQDEVKMKASMYSNPKYVQAMSLILPWMDQRGLLEWK